MNRSLPSLALVVLALLQGCGGGGSSSPPQADRPAAHRRLRTPPPSTGNSGLDARPANATCIAWPRPSAGSDISLSRFTNLTFTMPVALLQAPNDSSRWFVVQQNGIVRQFSGTSPTSASTYIDISAQSSEVLGGSEAGLLGMAFHPNYPADNRVFLSYTHNNPWAIRLSSFTSSDGGATLNPASEIQAADHRQTFRPITTAATSRSAPMDICISVPATAAVAAIDMAIAATVSDSPRCSARCYVSM